MQHKSIALILCFVAVMAAPPAQAEQPKYRVDFIGEVNNTSTLFMALNDLGEVAGQHRFHGLSGFASAYLYREGRMIEIDPSGAGHAAGLDINNRSEIVGWYSPSLESRTFSFLYRDGLISGLANDLGTEDIRGRAINNQGHATGSVDGQAFFYNGRTSRYLNFGDTRFIIPNDINEHDAIVGYLENSNKAFLYQEGQVTVLPSLGGDYSIAHAINNDGQIVGAGTTQSGAAYPVLYQGGKALNIGALPGSEGGEAWDINDHGWIVGSSYGSFGQSGFLYSDGEMHDLNGLLRGDLGKRVHVFAARGINEAGQILVEGQWLSGRSGSQPMLLTPIPEPAMYLMLCVGLGLIGAATSWPRHRNHPPAIHASPCPGK